MFTYLVLLFTIVPAIELVLLIKIGTYIGAVNTLMLIVLTGISGAALARLQGFSIIYRIQMSLQEGRMPTEEMLDGAMILVGGITLLTPGFITDVFGFLLLIPWSRSLIKFWLKESLKKVIISEEAVSINSESRYRQSDFEDADFH